MFLEQHFVTGPDQILELVLGSWIIFVWTSIILGVRLFQDHRIRTECPTCVNLMYFLILKTPWRNSELHVHVMAGKGNPEALPVSYHPSQELKLTASGHLHWSTEFLWALLTPQLYVQESWVIMSEGWRFSTRFVGHVLDWRQDDYQMCWGGCLDLPAHINMNVRCVIMVSALINTWDLKLIFIQCCDLGTSHWKTARLLSFVCLFIHLFIGCLFIDYFLFVSIVYMFPCLFDFAFLIIRSFFLSFFLSFSFFIYFCLFQ